MLDRQNFPRSLQNREVHDVNLSHRIVEQVGVSIRHLKEFCPQQNGLDAQESVALNLEPVPPESSNRSDIVSDFDDIEEKCSHSVPVSVRIHLSDANPSIAHSIEKGEELTAEKVFQPLTTNSMLSRGTTERVNNNDDFEKISSDENSSADMDSCSSNSDCQGANLVRNCKSSVRFDKHAVIFEIPNRLSYTKKQRRKMWNGSRAIKINAQRNKIEFQWEKWEWKNVVEEDSFCDVDGKKVHPAHTLSDLHSE